MVAQLRQFAKPWPAKILAGVPLWLLAELAKKTTPKKTTLTLDEPCTRASFPQETAPSVPKQYPTLLDLQTWFYLAYPPQGS